MHPTIQHPTNPHPTTQHPTNLHHHGSGPIAVAAGTRPDPHGTRRRHAFWRNVVGPQIDGEHGRQRRPVLHPID